MIDHPFINYIFFVQSASYSSTAGALQSSPLCSNYPDNAVLNGNMEMRTTPPQSTSGSASPYAPDMSPNLNARGCTVSSSQPPAARQAPAMVPGNDRQAPANPSSAYVFQGNEHRPIPASAIALQRNGSFDFGAYVNNSPISSAPTPPLELSYSYGGNVAPVGRDAMPAPLYTMSHVANGP